MNLLFPPELRTAAVVKRWSIVRTFNDDLVSSHSYFVTFYALQIARLVGWSGPYADLTFAALMHDAPEFVTGDLVSPVKRAIVDLDKHNAWVTEQMRTRMPGVDGQLQAIMDSEWGPGIDRIVKVADKVDAVLFLITEQRMGNTVLELLYNDALKNLTEAWTNLFGELGLNDDRRQDLWDDQIWPAIQAHWKNGSVGIQ